MEDLNSSENIPVSSNLPCSICGRTFRPDALERHVKICQKAASKRRKIFDSSKQRVEGGGTDKVKAHAHKKSQTKEKVAAQKPKSNWREQHQEFIRAIRAAKNADSQPVEILSGSSDSQATIPSGYVPCPSCGRNFSERAADRHIPWCQEQKSRVARSPASSDASERMKLRTKYRAPVPGKKDTAHKKSSSGSAFSSGTSHYSVPPKSPFSYSEFKDDDINNNGDANNNQISAVLAKRRTEKVKTSQETKRPKQQAKKFMTNGSNQKIGDAALSIKKVNIVLGKENQGRTGHAIMKFKEKFPNSNYRSIAMDENYEGYMLRNNNAYSRTPRTVPGVRTGGKNNFDEKTNFWKNHRNENEGDDLNLLQARFQELGSNFRILNGDTDSSWAKKMTHWDTSGSGLPQIGSSESPNQINKGFHQSQVGGSDTRVSTGSSSGGDDGSLPPISRANSTDGTRMPRFCHQCGTKYPVNGAKYCCECGARRLSSASGLSGQVK